jgi:hypothetical protein
MSSTVRKQPMRLSAVFSQMIAECPAQIAAYGNCIKNNLSHLQKDVCAKEFDVMKQCSERVITRMRKR